MAGLAGHHRGSAGALAALRRHRQGRESRRDSSTRSCSAWADRACVRKCCGCRSGRSTVSRSCTCSIPPIRRRSARSKRRSIWPRHCSSFRASPARRLSRTSSSNISSSASSRRGRGNRAVASSRSPIRARKCSRSRERDHFPQNLLRRAEHRRTLFRAVGFRHGSGGGDGHRRAAVPRSAPMSMAIACSYCVPSSNNPGVLLGMLLGTLARGGRDKVTIVASPGIRDLGAWLEQLLAESTGKNGKGLIPVDREPLGAPEVYGNDRVFVYARLEKAPMSAQDRAVDALAGRRAAGDTHRRERGIRSGPGIFPLGDRDRGGRIDSGDQRIQSAGRGGEQDRDAQADRRVREDRSLCRKNRRPSKRTESRFSARRRARRWWSVCART